MATGSKIKNNLVIQGDVTASAFSGDGSGLTGVGTVTDVSYLATTASNSFISDQTVTGSVIATGDSSRVRFLASTLSDLPSATDNHGMFAHVHSTGLGYYAHAGNWIPLATSESVANIDVTIPSTYLTTTAYTTETITKNFNYDTSLNVAEITSSVEGAIIDYRLTNLDSGSRVGTFMYAHDGTTLSYNDITIPGAGIGADPILSATLTGSIVSIDIENAAGFNFSGFAKKFSKLENAVPVADPNVSYLLDAYSGAVAAYSLRQLNQFYTGSCIKIRRDSDNSELDIGFDVNGNLDTAAISTHCGANNGYVEIWYDQSGNNNHAIQSTASLQLLIYDGSTVKTNNGLPCLSRGASTSYLDTSAVSITQPFSVFAVARHLNNTSNRFNALFSDSDSDVRFDTDSYNANNSFVMRAGGFLQTTGNRDFVQHLWSMLWNGASSYAYQDGTLEMSGNAGTNDMSNIRIAGTNNFGDVQELIFYNSDQSTNRTNIEDNINNYYDIYDTGLLAEYPGAAAAYSVRQLHSAYTGSALRIREDGTNTETDIGFDSNGDLDTASIASHCGANNGLVVTWYDQSGNGNDATQSTVGDQPKIYDSSTGVLIRNNKPYIDTRTSGTLPVANFAGSGTAGTYFAVTDTTGGFVDPMFGTHNNGMHGEYGPYQRIINAGASTNINAGYPPSSRYILSYSTIDSTNGSEAAIQGATATSFTTTGTTVRLGGISVRGTNGVKYTGGFMYEVIFYDSNQSSNRTGIETNINSYFNIY